MAKIRYILLVSFLCVVSIHTAFAQKNERDYLRSGNKLYKDSLFIKAEVDYRKAIELNPRFTEAVYNLGNSLLMQQKFKEAMEQYDLASKMEKNKSKLSQIYHNMGVIFQAGRQYAQAVEAYKQALRNNPKDDETRYNLALAQKLLEEQQGQDNQDNQNNEDNKDQEQNEEQQQKNQQQQEQEQQQNQQDQQQDQREDEMSKENAEQLLNAAMQDEKQTQEKIKKQQQQVQSRKLDKDW